MPRPALWPATTQSARARLQHRRRAPEAAQARALSAAERLVGGPIVGGKLLDNGADEIRRNPANNAEIIGAVYAATPADIEDAVHRARAAQPRWNTRGGPERARILRAMSNALEAETDRFIALLSREGGKTLTDGVSEVREAIDFAAIMRVWPRASSGHRCRFRARPAKPTASNWPDAASSPASRPGISRSPFLPGRSAAALAAGNAVLAKPAEQTVLVASEAVRLYHKAGLDPDTAGPAARRRRHRGRGAD